MNKKAIIVIVLFFFIGNAIAVRHVGYGAEVCCANTMPSDEDDYQKEIIAKFGDLYFDSSENPEETTNKFDAMYLRLYYYTGGTMGIICQADAPMNIAYIRMACLKDDYDLFANKQKPSFAKMKVIDSSAWNEELHQALTSVKYETQDKELIKSYGSASEYKQLYCQLEKYAVDTKTLLARWVTQRRNAEQLLSDSQQGNYRNHTLMVVNALAYHLYNNRTL